MLICSLVRSIFRASKTAGRKTHRPSGRSPRLFEELETRVVPVVGNGVIPPEVPANGYTGVVQLQIGSGTCTGTLLNDGLHILTAAHCLTESFDDDPPPGTRPTASLPEDITVNFQMRGYDGERKYPTAGVSRVHVHPDWLGHVERADGSGSPLSGYDIALLKLDQVLPTGVEMHEIYRDDDEIFQLITLVGYGQTGDGATPAVTGGAKLVGQNIFELTAEELNNEVKTMRVLAFEGTFRLGYPPSGPTEWTQPMPFNVSAGVLADELESLSAFDIGDITSVTKLPGELTWIIAFGGQYAGENVLAFQVDKSDLVGSIEPDVTFKVWDGARFTRYEPGTTLAFDFDNGTAQRDSFGNAIGQFNTGVVGAGNLEADNGRGDSGGPAFIGGKVAGVVSFGATPGTAFGDVDSVTNNTWGEFEFHTRVSTLAGWIDYTIAQDTGPDRLVLNVAGQIDGDTELNTYTPKEDVTTLRRLSGNRIEYLINGRQVYVGSRQDFTSLVVKGSGDPDRLILDYSGGDPIGTIPFELNFATAFPGLNALDIEKGFLEIDPNDSIKILGDVRVSGSVLMHQGSLTLGGQSKEFAGLLRLDDSDVTGERVRISGRLEGGGIITSGNGNDPGELAIREKGVLSPGLQRFLEHAIIEADTLIFEGGSTYEVHVTGAQPGYNPVAGVDYDSVYASSGVSISQQARLDVDLWYQATPQVGETYTLIYNFGTQPTSGHFADLMEGAVLNLNGIPFQITYQGGDGNDVELIVQDGRPMVGSIDVNPATITDSGNDTITLTANDVTTPLGAVDGVRFYIDANDNGVLDIGADGFLLPNTDRQLGSGGIDGNGDAQWQGYVTDLSPGVYKVFAQARRYTHSQILLSSPVSTTLTINAAPTPDPSAVGGADDLVNVTTTGFQSNGLVERDPNGNTTVVWWDANASTARMRRFDAAGAQIQAETALAGAKQITSFAVKSDGSFIAVWTFESDLFAQEYTANGAADGSVITVINDFNLRRESARVAVDAAGNFVVVWFQGSYFTDEKAFYRRFAANGTAQGPATRADTDSVGAERTVDVGMDAQGNFVVAWVDTDNAYGGARNLRASRFDSNGNRVGDPFNVDTRANDVDLNDLGDGILTMSVSMNAAGDWVAAWIANGDDPFDQFSRGIYARRFRSDGNARDATEFRVNTVVAGDQYYPVVDLADDGHFAVLFTGSGQAGTSAYGQVYGPDGVPLGAVFRVPGDLNASSVTATGLVMLPGADSVTIWMGNGPGDSSGIFWRSFIADAVTNLAPDAPPVTQTASGDGATNVVVPASDPEGGPLELRDIDGKQVGPGGSVMLPSGATVSMLAGLAAETAPIMLVYDPNGAFDSMIAGDMTTDSFTYTVQDNQGKHTTSVVTLNLSDGNDAPVLTSGLPLIGETDGTTPLVFAIADLINKGDRSTRMVDADRDAVVGGVAVSATSGTGIWEYSVDGGNVFAAIGEVGLNAALLLPPHAMLRYTPNSSLGESATITYRAWDQTTGVAEDRSDLTAGTGGETPFSAASDSATVTVVDEAPPRIVAVRVRGTGWNANLPSFEIEVGSNDQLVPIPWTNVDQVQIQFNEAVSVPVNAAALVGPGGVVTSATAVAYAPATFTVTFTFPVPLTNERLSLDLSAILVADGSNRSLDGEWTNVVGNFPTGDGQPGGDFSFQFTALPGDVDGNTQVNVFDVLLTRLRLGQNTTAPGVAPHFDVNGDGAVNVLDVLLTRLRLGNQLPASVSAAAASAREAPPVEKTVQASALASALTVSAPSRSVEDAVDLVLSTDAGFELRPQMPEHPVQRSRRLSRLRLDSPSETGAWSQWRGFGSSR